jgi:hypothetical protein
MFFNQDAVTTLLINGEVVGRSHLAAALFRTHNIPARVLLVHNDQGFWTQMHYMLEYYVPEYGWVLLDPTKGETPYATQRQIINRICSLDDELDTKYDYIFPLMRGEERWMWYNEDILKPYFFDCDIGSKSQMFTENNILLNESTAKQLLNDTHYLFSLYQRFLAEEVQGSDQDHFNNATNYLYQAGQKFKQGNVEEYELYLELALYELYWIDPSIINE